MQRSKIWEVLTKEEMQEELARMKYGQLLYILIMEELKKRGKWQKRRRVGEGTDKGL